MWEEVSEELSSVETKNKTFCTLHNIHLRFRRTQQCGNEDRIKEEEEVELAMFQKNLVVWKQNNSLLCIME